MNNDSINFETKRKLFHVASLVFPVIYFFTSKTAMVITLGIVTALAIFLDTYRHSNKKIKGVLDKILGKLMREEEKISKNRLASSSYMAIGFFLTCLLFPKKLAITSLFILIACDSFAAIVGMRHGERLANGKSYEGAAAFFISAILVSIFCYLIIGYKTSFSIIFLSSFFTTFAEFYSQEVKINDKVSVLIDDNLSIPLTYAICTLFFGAIFLG